MDVKDFVVENTENEVFEQESLKESPTYENSGANGMRLAAVISMIFGFIAVLVGIVCIFGFKGEYWIAGLFFLFISTTYFFYVAVFRSIATMAEAAYLYKEEKLKNKDNKSGIKVSLT